MYALASWLRFLLHFRPFFHFCLELCNFSHEQRAATAIHALYWQFCMVRVWGIDMDSENAIERRTEKTSINFSHLSCGLLEKHLNFDPKSTSQRERNEQKRKLASRWRWNSTTNWAKLANDGGKVKWPKYAMILKIEAEREDKPNGVMVNSNHSLRLLKTEIEKNALWKNSSIWDLFILSLENGAITRKKFTVLHTFDYIRTKKTKIHQK